MKKQRIPYAILFLMLLVTEILIGLYVNDNFVRPYVGDVLITILLCCLFRTITQNKVKLLWVYVFIFATFVEFAQYIQIVKILGLENNRLLATIIGTSFSHIDLVCYGIGCLLFWASETFVRALINKKREV